MYWSTLLKMGQGPCRRSAVMSLSAAGLWPTNNSDEKVGDLKVGSHLAFKEKELGPRPKEAIQGHITGGILKVPSPDLTHSFLVKQATALSLETSLSLLTRSLSSFMDFSKEYEQNMSSLAAIFEMQSDNLPTMFSNQEVYNQMVQLKIKVKEDRKQLLELELLLDYAKKLLEVAIETSFLVGLDESAARASEQLVAIEQTLEGTQSKLNKLKQELRMAEVLHIKQAGNAPINQSSEINQSQSSEINQSQSSEINQSQSSEINQSQSQEELDKLAKDLKPFETEISEEQIKITSIPEVKSEKESESQLFKFQDFSDDAIKFSIKDPANDPELLEDKTGENKEEDLGLNEDNESYDSKDDVESLRTVKQDKGEQKTGDFQQPEDKFKNTYKFPTF